MASIQKRVAYGVNGKQIWSEKKAREAAAAAGIPWDQVPIVDTRWRAQVRRQGMKPQTRTFKTKKAAVRWAREAESGFDRGAWKDPLEARRTKMSDLIDRYDREIASQNRGYESSEKYRIQALKRHMGGMTLAELTPEWVYDYIKSRKAKVIADTIIRELNILQGLLTTAGGLWRMPLPWDDDGHPVKLARKEANLKDSEFRDRRLTADEEARYLDKAASYDDGWLLHYSLLAIETGARRGELAQLTYEMIDDDEAVLTWPKEITKTERSRAVPLTPVAMQAILAMSELRETQTGSVFQRSARSISQAILRICRATNIPDFHGHDLRHESASRLIDRGLSILEAQAVTGHRTVSMLQRYVNPRLSDIRRKMLAGSNAGT